MRNPIATLREEWRSILKNSVVFAAVCAVSQIVFTFVLIFGLYQQTGEARFFLVGSAAGRSVLTFILQVPWAACVCLAVFCVLSRSYEKRWAVAAAIYVASVVVPPIFLNDIFPLAPGSATALYVSIWSAVLMGGLFTALHLYSNRRNVAA